MSLTHTCRQSQRDWARDQRLHHYRCDSDSVAGSGYKGHVEFLAPTVKELAQLEKSAQTSFIDLKYKKKFA